MNVKSLLHLALYGLSARPRNYETGCLGAWKGTLDQAGLDILDKQLAMFDCLWREGRGKMFIFGRRDNSFDWWPGDAIFPLFVADDGVRVASMTLKLMPTAAVISMKAHIVLYKGRLFSIEFSKRPVKVRDGEFEISGIKVMEDPMHPRSERHFGEASSTSELSGWLKGWAPRVKADGIPRPLLEEEWLKLCEKIDAWLPSDYLALSKLADGLLMDGCRVYGLSEVRRILWPEANYYILAESESGTAVAVQEGREQGQVYLIDDDLAEPVGDSFRRAMEKMWEVDQA